jgi:hypothetical protein
VDRETVRPQVSAAVTRSIVGGIRVICAMHRRAWQPGRAAWPPRPRDVLAAPRR